MNIRLHANATTTPKTRHYIQASNQSVTQLADELGVSETPSAVGNAVTALPMVLTHHTACRPPSPRPRKWWSWNCARRCCCRLMTCWW